MLSPDRIYQAESFRLSLLFHTEVASKQTQAVIKREPFAYLPIILQIPFEIEVFVVSGRMRRCLLISIEGTRDRISKSKLSIERVRGTIGKAD